MKRDSEVLQMFKERAKGRTQVHAAARTGMSVRTLRTYEHSGQLPSQLQQPRHYRTRPNPFVAVWPWAVAHLERDPALQTTTLYALLQQQHPGQFSEGQLRTFQAHVSRWRAEHGPEQEVYFPQVHQPGETAQSDFTAMADLEITLCGMPFPHLLYHLVCVYSNMQAVRICFSAAIKPLDPSSRAEAKDRYTALLRHYGLQATANNAGAAHENGDVEQAHYRFKQAVDQALRVRGSREFADRAAYQHFLLNLVKQRNLRRSSRWAEEQADLQPLPRAPLALCREVRAPVSRFSTIQVLRNTYSVPSRLIERTVLVRIRSEILEVYLGTQQLLSMPRLLGQRQHRIDYHHVIWSLVRKPGAFAQYRYRDHLFPTVTLRRAYDALASGEMPRADRHYVRLLQLAASTSEVEVETALSLLLEQGQALTFDAVLDLRVYDRLLTGTAEAEPQERQVAHG